MIEITTKYYLFDELSKEAQAKACEDNRTFEVDFNDWADPVIEGAEDDLMEIGWDNVEISYSGFWSQGDGASFTGKVCDLTKLNKAWELGLTKLQIAVIEDYMYIKSLRNTHHYSHENTVYVDIEWYSGKTYKRFERLLVMLQDNIQAMVREKSQKIYSDLSDYYDALTSAENVAESLRSNEYYFREDGSDHCFR